jgi:hypothetical protein
VRDAPPLDGPGGLERGTPPLDGPGGLERGTPPLDGPGGLERGTPPLDGPGGLERGTPPLDGPGGLERGTPPLDGPGGLERGTPPLVEAAVLATGTDPVGERGRSPAADPVGERGRSGAAPVGDFVRATAGPAGSPFVSTILSSSALRSADPGGGGGTVRGLRRGGSAGALGSPTSMAGVAAFGVADGDGAGVAARADVPGSGSPASGDSTVQPDARSAIRALVSSPSRRRVRSSSGTGRQ